MDSGNIKALKDNVSINMNWRTDEDEGEITGTLTLKGKRFPNEDEELALKALCNLIPFSESDLEAIFLEERGQQSHNTVVFGINGNMQQIKSIVSKIV